MPLSIPPLAIRSLFLNYFQLAAFLLSLTLSHTFSPFHTLILVSFASFLRCPSPSLLIRAICWRGRQRDLRMDRIVLYVESVVQFWSQSCAYMRGNVAHACVCLTVCMHAVTCESDSTYGPDFKRLLSVLTVCTSISPQLWVFYNPSIIPVFLSPSSLHPLNTSLFITSLLPPGGCDYSHILILVAPSMSSAL